MVDSECVDRQGNNCDMFSEGNEQGDSSWWEASHHRVVWKRLFEEMIFTLRSG